MNFEELRINVPKMWQRSFDNESNYWKDISNLKSTEFDISNLDNYEKHLPQITIPHGPNTCFISATLIMLEMMLSYMASRNSEEEKLYKLLNRVRVEQDDIELNVLLVNMQCLVFNPKLALNKRNKELILKNIPIVSEFNVKTTIEGVIEYNRLAIQKTFGINLTSELRIIRDKLQLNPYVALTYLAQYITQENKENCLFIYFLNDSKKITIIDNVLNEISDILHKKDETNFYYQCLVKIGYGEKTNVVKDDIMNIFMNFTNVYIDYIEEMNNLFIDTVRTNDWQKAPYLFDLMTILDPRFISMTIMNRDRNDRTFNVRKMLFKMYWKLNDKVISVPEFMKMLIVDNRVKLNYGFSKPSMQFNFEKTYLNTIGLDYNGAFDIKNGAYAYDNRQINHIGFLNRYIRKSIPLFVNKRHAQLLRKTEIVFKEVSETFESGQHWNVKIIQPIEMQEDFDLTATCLDDCINTEIPLDEEDVNENINFYMFKTKSVPNHPKIEYVTFDIERMSNDYNFCLVVPSKTLENENMHIKGGKLIISVIILIAVIVIVVIVIILKKSNEIKEGLEKFTVRKKYYRK